MKNLLLLLLLCPFVTSAQQAVVHFDVKNSGAKEITLLKGNVADADVLFGPYSTDILLKDGKAVYTSALSRPVFLTVYFQGDTTQRSSLYIFYLSPGDNLNFSVDARNPEASVVVTGKGSEHNQPDIQPLTGDWLDLSAHKKDTVPGPVFNSIKKQAEINRQVLKKYLAKHKASKEFIATHTLFVQYYPTWTYIRFKGNQKFNNYQAYARNDKAWEKLEDSLVHATPLSKPELLDISTHTYFLQTYLTRLKEKVWAHPELASLYRAPEDNTDILKTDPENLLREKIVDKEFTGATAEYLYAVIFKGSIGEKEDYLPEIYARFKMKYPESQYRPFIDPGIQGIVARRKRQLNDNMVLVKDPDTYQTLEDVLKLVKGKTVLLDMWGTWCGPCRAELLQHSDSTKSHFKGKGLDYLYIANYDQLNEAKWKELISYYGLTGMHILASKNLTKDIMSKVKGSGYPTYVIIKKDGTFEQSTSGYPLRPEVLYGELEKALKD